MAATFPGHDTLFDSITIIIYADNDDHDEEEISDDNINMNNMFLNIILMAHFHRVWSSMSLLPRKVNSTTENRLHVSCKMVDFGIKYE
jgi:hypothetical protein